MPNLNLSENDLNELQKESEESRFQHPQFLVSGKLPAFVPFCSFPDCSCGRGLSTPQPATLPCNMVRHGVECV